MFKTYQLTWHQSLQFCSKCVGSFATPETKEEAVKIEGLIYNISVFNKGQDSNI